MKVLSMLNLAFPGYNATRGRRHHHIVYSLKINPIICSSLSKGVNSLHEYFA